MSAGAKSPCMMEKHNGGVLGGKFTFKKYPDGNLDKSKVVCTICKAEFTHHRSNLSLVYHIKAKHLDIIDVTSKAAARPCQSTLLLLDHCLKF